MDATGLPPEIWRTIASQSLAHGAQAVFSLLLTCKDIQEQAEPVLYRSIDMGAFWSTRQYRVYRQRARDNPQSFFHYHNGKFTSFLTAVIDNRRLANHVHSFVCYLEDSLDHHSSPEFLSLLRNALSHLRNLRNLSFKTFDHSSIAFILKGYTFQLESLSWYCGDDREHLLPFLEHQTTLQLIELEWTDPSPVPTHISLNITTIRNASRCACLAFMPGRSITSLYWFPAYDKRSLSVFEFDALAQELQKLEKLDMGCFLRPEPFWAFATHLQNLRYLSLIGVDSGDEKAIVLIRNLQHLKLSLRPAAFSEEEQLHAIDFIDEPRQYVEDLFETLQDLQMVDVETMEDGFDRYWRDLIEVPLRMLGDIHDWEL